MGAAPLRRGRCFLDSSDATVQTEHFAKFFGRIPGSRIFVPTFDIVFVVAVIVTVASAIAFGYLVGRQTRPARRTTTPPPLPDPAPFRVVERKTPSGNVRTVIDGPDGTWIAHNFPGRAKRLRAHVRELNAAFKAGVEATLKQIYR